MTKPEVFPATPGSPLGCGKPIGDLFNKQEMRQLMKLAAKKNVPVTVLVHDLCMEEVQR